MTRAVTIQPLPIAPYCNPSAEQTRAPSCTSPPCIPTFSHPSPILPPTTHLHISFGVSPRPRDPCYVVPTSPATTWGQGKKRQHHMENQWHFLTVQADLSRSGHSIVVLFHLLLETNGSRKIDKSEVTQLLLLAIFSSNQLGEEGMTKKWHFDQTGCFQSKFSF